MELLPSYKRLAILLEHRCKNLKCSTVDWDALAYLITTYEILPEWAELLMSYFIQNLPNIKSIEPHLEPETVSSG